MDGYTHIKIPRQFRAEASGDLLHSCAICRKDAVKSGEVYMIDKAFRKGHLMFEHVICRSCLLWLADAFSAESIRRLEAYMGRYENPARFEGLMRTSPGRIEPWISHCYFSGRPVEECDDYNLKGYAIEDVILLMPDYPSVTGGEAAEAIWQLFSAESLAHYERVCRDYLGIPPEVLRNQSDQARSWS